MNLRRTFGDVLVYLNELYTSRISKVIVPAKIFPHCYEGGKYTMSLNDVFNRFKTFYASACLYRWRRQYVILSVTTLIYLEWLETSNFVCT